MFFTINTLEFLLASDYILLLEKHIKHDMINRKFIILTAERDMEKITAKDFIKIPNLMSMFRILLIPVFLYFAFSVGFEEGKLYIFSVLLLSWLTDILDGFIARKYNMISELGKILDPMADKLTQLAILFALWLSKLVPAFVFIIIFIKEFLLSIGALYLKKFIKTNIIPSNYWGKAATGCFYISVALLILKDYVGMIGMYGIYLTLILMIIAFISYWRILLQIMRKEKEV